MKVPLVPSKFYTNLDLLSMPITELTDKIGAQLGAVEEVENLGEKYQGVLVARVVSCRKHENSDHLNVCLLDDGGAAKDVARNDDGLVQVVCGAPNVREGLTVAWLPPGSTVPESYAKDPFVLGARELRGVMSNGMLASPRELALSDEHDGILELEDTMEPGTPFAEACELNDYVIDIENKMFTHRPDCFGLLGVYREIAGITGQKFVGPDWYNPGGKYSLESEAEALPLTIQNELPELVPRFMAVALSGITIKPSPLWLQVHLMRVGIRPINNIVDATNYIMVLTGQPLHAYDYDKVRALSGGSAAEITVRYPHASEQITLLNGKQITPREEAIMIASGNHLIGVGGVMGGEDTEVSNETKNIILEVATFDMYSIRRTAMAHGLFTDAVTRFNKGQSPLQNDKVLAKAVHEIRVLADGKVAGPVIDESQVHDRSWVHPPISLPASFITERLGVDLKAADMQRLLENVECTVTLEGEVLTITAPFWRTDIETREDVVEEVGRLYGFDKLPLELPRRSIQPVTKNPMLELKSKVRDILATAGANEVLTYSFVHGDLLTKVGQKPVDAYQIGNALSPDLQYYRLSLTPSLLDKVHGNIKAGYDEFALFEMGKGHGLNYPHDVDGLPAEYEMLDVVYARSDRKQKSGAAFYEARAFLMNLSRQFGVPLEFRQIDKAAKGSDHPMVQPYDLDRSAEVYARGIELPIGIIGEYKTSVRKALKLPVHTAGFGLGLTQLMQASATAKVSYMPLPRFPKITQDITLKVSADVPNGDLRTVFYEKIAEFKQQGYFAHAPMTDIYQAEGSDSKNVTFRLSIASHERTMTDAEVSKMLGSIAEKAHEAFGAEVV
jgi:phenylalanyl-tRNA synthetase beta chain